MTHQPDFNGAVGQNLQLLRKAAGLSQADLAEHLSARGYPFAQQTVLKVEKGTRPLKLDEAAQIADVVGVTISDLFSPPGTPGRGEAIRQQLICLGREHAAEQGVRDAEQALTEARSLLEMAHADSQKAQAKVNTNHG